MDIVGICRFSMLGRGDWKVYKNQPDDALAALYEEKAKELFDPVRLEARLSTFRYLCCASMAAQSDQDFKFIVISSNRMPEPYRTQLTEICASLPQIILRFTEPMHVSHAAEQIFSEMGLDQADTIQFRLDDDDCVSIDYVRRLRRLGSMLEKQGIFGVSFSQQYYFVTDGPTQGVYNWHSPFFSAGAAIRHPRHTIFDYGHYNIQRRMMCVTDPGFPNLVTHRGDNDTPRHEAAILRKRGMVPATPEEIRRIFERHFPFVTREGLRRCDLEPLVAKHLP